MHLPSIVIAEDDADDLFFIFRRLKQAGLENPLLSFANAHAALGYFEEALRSGDKSNMPGAVITDLYLPGVGGLELVARLRSEPRLADLRIIVLSGSENPAHRRRAEELNVDGFALKFPPAREFRQLLSCGTGGERRRPCGVRAGLDVSSVSL